MNPNLDLISDLKNFISESINNKDLKQLFTRSKKDFTRNRKLDFERVVLILINFLRKSYSTEISDLYNLIENEDTRVSKSAFSQQG